MVESLWVKYREGISERFEDGTSAFLNILALKFGFELMNNIGGIPLIEEYTNKLIRILYSKLSAMKHYNGKEICKILGRHSLNDITQQGPVCTCIFYRANGDIVGHREFERLASLNNIHIRVNSFLPLLFSLFGTNNHTDRMLLQSWSLSRSNKPFRRTNQTKY